MARPPPLALSALDLRLVQLVDVGSVQYLRHAGTGEVLKVHDGSTDRNPMVLATEPPGELVLSRRIESAGGWEFANGAVVNGALGEKAYPIHLWKSWLCDISCTRL